ncbi:MAG: diguanylate cyclase [Betaproteobacteria bacterium]|nr:diguanylate cyclase [Betaproteobacteria bacterium]
MPTFSNPSEIARETLRLLASRRMPPSPDNYRALYHEISGTVEKANHHFPERELKSLLAALPKETPAQQRLARQLEQALKDESWESYRGLLVDFLKANSKVTELAWSELIGDFLRQWESKQARFTPGRKRDALEHVLAGSASNSEILFGRLQNLVKSWALDEAPAGETGLVDEIIDGVGARPSNGAPPAPAGAPAAQSRESERFPELRDLFAYALEGPIAAQLAEEPELSAEVLSLAKDVRGARSPQDIEKLQAGMKRLAFRLELITEDRAELRSGLLHLLRLLIENVSELVMDDRWLHGQIEVVRDILAHPLSIRSLDDAEHRLKEVIFKQSQLKQSLNEAKEALKQMLAGFVDHLAEFADSTSDYHDKIEICAEKISKAEDISQLEDVLGEVMRETRIIQINAQRSRDDLRAAKQHVEEADKRIGELQGELDKASHLVRHDQLTGTLNRRGLDEAFEKESSRAQRRESPLCVAMLDIDNFKKLNDSLGHDAGDAALIHLTSVIKDTLRPQDTVGRFGGEEFIILLPDTPLDDAQRAIVRLQRELTKRFFLHDNDKVLITFSAGVTEMRQDDTQPTVTKRADEAMYAAKQTGKNRVVTG